MLVRIGRAIVEFNSQSFHLGETYTSIITFVNGCPLGSFLSSNGRVLWNFGESNEFDESLFEIVLLVHAHQVIALSLYSAP